MCTVNLFHAVKPFPSGFYKIKDDNINKSEALKQQNYITKGYCLRAYLHFQDSIIETLCFQKSFK